MSPTSFCYIDYYQGDPAHEPLAIGGYLPLKQVYAFEPVPDVLGEDGARHILGGQVNLWTEYVHEGPHAEYMALPRLAALAEAVWSAKERRSWDDFAARTRGLLARYEAAGLKAARSAFLVTIRAAASPGAKPAAATMSTEIPALTIRYTTDGTDPGPRSTRYAKPLVLKKTTELRAAAFEAKTRLSPAVSTERFLVHLASYRVPLLTTPPSPKYPGAGETPLTDGLLGSTNHADGRWQGFEDSDFEAVVDLGAPKRIGRISVRFGRVDFVDRIVFGRTAGTPARELPGRIPRGSTELPEDDDVDHVGDAARPDEVRDRPRAATRLIKKLIVGVACVALPDLRTAGAVLVAVEIAQIPEKQEAGRRRASTSRSRLRLDDLPDGQRLTVGRAVGLDDLVGEVGGGHAAVEHAGVHAERRGLDSRPELLQDLPIPKLPPVLAAHLLDLPPDLPPQVLNPISRGEVVQARDGMRPCSPNPPAERRSSGSVAEHLFEFASDQIAPAV